MAPKRNVKGDTKNATPPERNILITAGEGQTGRLIIELLLQGDDYAGKATSLSALVFSEDAKASLAEFEGLNVLIYDPQNEEALLEGMQTVDTCLLIPPARKVRLTLFLLRPNPR